ncbi:protein canopy homolog 3-like [Oppia nitens]|uniref:protein canopy homolog 3-like n=1 Tax=Oppia nitens TaxID=1686743 RepID=UPI0023DA82CA|nr:protein canopy homolog 3-like [Oppia nitens]
MSFGNKLFVTITLFAIIATICLAEEKSVEEEVYGVKYANNCEVCKYLVIELEERLKQTGKTHDVIETGYGFDDQTRHKKKYVVSELRLVESLDGICETLLEYNIHKERKDSTRFAKGMSTTFKTLHGLVDKGVKVDLGMPFDLWDKPSAEVTHMKTQCEDLLEKHESDIENWYFNHQKQPLNKYLCVDRVLKRGDAGCLDETLSHTNNNNNNEKQEL